MEEKNPFGYTKEEVKEIEKEILEEEIKGIIPKTKKDRE